VLPTPSADHSNELRRHWSWWERIVHSLVLITCEWCKTNVHKNSHVSPHTHGISTVRHALNSWDPALACEASNFTIRSTLSQQRVRSVHTFRTPATPQT
jgi:hypothetical protein